jgi:phage terminase large subunit
MAAMTRSGIIELPEKLVPVFSGEALYRGAYGGRGSAKSRSFAKMAAVHGLRCAQAKQSGVIVCGREFQNSLDESSMAEVKQAIESEPWLAKNYEIGEKYIRTKDGRIDFTFVGLRRNIESVKSTARIRLLWVDEAEPVSEVAWQKAIPTVREEGAEIWVTWNPERRASATNQRFRINPPLDSKIVEVNYKDNPWFPSVLEQIRQEDERVRPDQYGHVWLGDYATAHVGAYFARHLNEAQEEGRISKVMRDPLLPIRVYCDLGGTGAKSDAFAMWVCQFVGREVRVLDYYEAVGEPLAVHVQWLRDGGYGKADIYLPHDGASHDMVFDVSFESAFRQAGFKTEVIPNQGRGAAKMRIEAARRLFPSVWFNKETTEAGRDALGWYHEKRSEDVRDVGLGPEHDWCLKAGTQILTPIGWRKVEDICEHDKVLTPIGERRILRSGIVRVTGEWVTVKGIRCTPEHRFFTSRGLVRSDRLLSSEEFWTRDAWGLSFLGYLSAVCCFGLKTGITLATQEGKPASADAARCSFIGWFMRLCMVRSRRAMRSITSMMTRLITTLTTSKLCPALPTAAATNPSRGISASAEFAAGNLAVTRCSVSDAVPSVSERIAHEPSAPVEPAYNLTVDVDECYFVRGDDDRAYLVSNSSHGSDAFGLLAVAYEMPQGRPQKLKYQQIGIV